MKKNYVTMRCKDDKRNFYLCEKELIIFDSKLSVDITWSPARKI